MKMNNARNRIRLTFTILIMLTAIAFSKVAVAEPQRPSRQFVPLPPFITLSGVCSFDVRIDPLGNKEYATVWVDHAGTPTTIITTGLLKVRLTNLQNSKSIDLNISGPGTQVFNGDGSSTFTTYGPWLWFLFPGVLPNFSPRMFFISGQLVVQIDSHGDFTSMRIIGGQVVDMCAALADS